MTTTRRGTAVQLLGPSTGGIRNHVTTLAAGLRDLGWSAPVLGPEGVLDGIGQLDGVVAVPAGMSPFSPMVSSAISRRPPSSLQTTRTRFPAPAPKPWSKAARMSAAVIRRPTLRSSRSATGEAFTSYSSLIESLK